MRPTDRAAPFISRWLAVFGAFRSAMFRGNRGESNRAIVRFIMVIGLSGVQFGL